MIHRDLSGKTVPSGRVEKELVCDFLDGTLPYWLTQTNGVGTFNSLKNSNLSYKMTTGSAIESRADLRSMEFDLRQLNEVMVTVNSLVVDSNEGIKVGIKFDEVNAGVALVHTNTNVLATIEVNTTNFSSIPYQLRGADISGRRKNISFGINTVRKEVFVMEDDQIIAYKKVPTVNLGVTHLTIEIYNLDGKPHTLSMSQLKLKFIHN